MSVQSSYGQITPKKKVSDKKSSKNQLVNPDDSKLAIQYYRDQQFDKAVVIYEKLYDQNPSYVNYTYYLYCLVQLKDYKKAEQLAKKQIRKFPHKPRYLVDLGYVYHNANESVKAKKKFEEALSKMPDNRREITELANAFQSKRETEYAVQAYVQGRKMLNYEYSFHLELGIIYQNSGKYEEMFNEYLDLLEEDLTKIETVQSKLQNVLNDDPDNTINELFRIALLKRIQKNPDLSFYSEMLLWYSVQQKDFETALMQAKALDRRYREEGQRVFDLARLCTANKDYDVSIEAYEYLVSKGENSLLYTFSRVELLNVQFLAITESYKNDTNDLLELEKSFLSTLDEFGKSQTTLSLMLNLARLQAFYLDKSGEAIELLNSILEMRNLSRGHKANCKLELADILLLSGEPWEATLLYSQVEKSFKNDPLGHQAKFKNAKLTYYIGEFLWAKAQLDVLKAATSKLIANDAMELALLLNDNMGDDTLYTALKYYAKADLLLYQNKYEEALLILDSIDIVSPGNTMQDEVFYKKAEIKLGQGKFEEADQLYAELIEQYPFEILADNALFKRAVLQEEVFKDNEKAMELYQKLLTEYPGSLFVVEARKRFRILRGDVI